MNNNKPSFGKLTWKMTIMLIAGLIPAEALSLYIVFKEKGYLARADWIVAVIVFSTISVILLVVTCRANLKRKAG